MKVCSKQLLTVGTILVAIAVAGCATSKSSDAVPPRPSCETEEQLTTAEACEAVYSCCTRACADTRTSRDGRAKDECMDACTASLEECYRAIE